MCRRYITYPDWMRPDSIATGISREKNMPIALVGLTYSETLPPRPLLSKARNFTLFPVTVTASL